MSSKFTVEYIAGGATQNSIRVAQVSNCNIFVIVVHESEKKTDLPFLCWFAVDASNPWCNKLHGLYREGQVW